MNNFTVAAILNGIMIMTGFIAITAHDDITFMQFGIVSFIRVVLIQTRIDLERKRNRKG
jgi:hypothetical protein